MQHMQQGPPAARRTGSCFVRRGAVVRRARGASDGWRGARSAACDTSASARRHAAARRPLTRPLPATRRRDRRAPPMSRAPCYWKGSPRYDPAATPRRARSSARSLAVRRWHPSASHQGWQPPAIRHRPSLHGGYGVVTWWLRGGYGVATGWLRGGYGVVTGWLRGGYVVVTWWLRGGYVVVTRRRRSPVAPASQR